MKPYTVMLFRSGRVWVTQTPDTPSHDTDPPLLVEQVTANTEIAALGKLLLKYVDAAKQPYQDIPICIEECCHVCVCGEVKSRHTASMDMPHAFQGQPS